MNGHHALPRTAVSGFAGDATLGTAITRIWPVFAASWPGFVLIGPVAVMLDAAGTPLERLGTLGWTVAFLAAYGWLTLYRPFPTEVSRRERRVHITLLALLTGLVIYADLVNPAGYFWLFIGVIIPAGVVLPTRAAAWMAAALTALAIAIDVPRSGWSAAMQVPGISIWGIVTILLRRLVLMIDSLRIAREERARLAVAEERLRFARDLHDLLGHSLSLIALKSELAGRLIQASNPRAASEIADIERVARQALREGREAVSGYRQPALHDELDSVREMLVAAGIGTRIDAQAGALPPAVDAVLAWTVREGATNVIRHSHARNCHIRIWREDGVVHADVIDDGRGAPAVPAGATSSGLSGIAERAAESGGWVEAGPGDTGGFALRVLVPVTGSPGEVPSSSEPGEVVRR